MAKPAYKIPATLDQSWGDMEITLQSNSGVGIRPMPIKLILTYIVSFLVCAYVVLNTFVKDGGFWIVPFVIIWVILTFLLLKRDDTDLPQYQLVTTLLDYLPKPMRRLSCRPDDDVRNVMPFVGVFNYDPSTGLMEFVDGTFGYAFMVTGSASVLLFDEDQAAILDRVDSFFRKIHEDVELIFITNKEAQKVNRQLDAELARYAKFSPDEDPDLKQLSDTRFRCLRDYVGGTFRSIHQYLVLKADNKEALEVAKNVLRGEVENSALMFKRCVGLAGDDVNKMFYSIYKGKESV